MSRDISELFYARRGPQGRRRKVEQCARVDVREEVLRDAGLHRLGLIGQPVEIVRTPCHFGGSRPYFLCPDCTRRCLYLYAVVSAGRHSCRVCLDLIYSSEGEGTPRALRRRQRKLEALLGRDRSRPTRMHVSTFLRIRRALDEVDGKVNGLLLKAFRAIVR